MTPDVPSSSPTSLVAVLIIAVVALAGVIAFLFRFYATRMEAKDAALIRDREERSREREAWAADRARLERFQLELRGEYEAKYHATLKELLESAREQEALARRDYADNIEAVSRNAIEAAKNVAEALDKMRDRLLGPRRRTD